ncbi:amidohydrolase family protein [Sphingobacterium hungaricum]|uniref:Amidohydrolase n=1 Tax=Sphingobacterium hungaricum TaxID=2082723 RepID=A0A928YQI6_9SPHI|nr:amidohydrolase family protein [Sphingobacterium hungaricum]MBE8714266.1 amidohydrolase [Sphingobacterium hungaricum]
MRIDAHQHFWIYDAVKDAWITDEMAVLQRNFMPTDLAPVLKANQIDGVIAVQADQSLQETQFLVDLSTMYAMIKAVVGWVDLQSPTLHEQLNHFRQFPIIKGFRHIVEAESDPDFLLRDAVQGGIEKLTEYGYTYDLLVKPIHYPAALSCVRNNPEQQFILDHMAKPNIKDKAFEDWAQFIDELGRLPNVACKISGLATESDWENWELVDFAPYIQHAVRSFGKDRLLFGSDWPVCYLAASYEEVIAIVENNLVDFTSAELNGFWGENAKRIYKF